MTLPGAEMRYLEHLNLLESDTAEITVVNVWTL